jgi:hypothetical protein
MAQRLRRGTHSRSSHPPPLSTSSSLEATRSAASDVISREPHSLSRLNSEDPASSSRPSIVDEPHGTSSLTSRESHSLSRQTTGVPHTVTSHSHLRSSSRFGKGTTTRYDDYIYAFLYSMTYVALTSLIDTNPSEPTYVFSLK